MISRCALALCLAMILGACASMDRSFGSSSDIQVTALESLPEPRGDLTYMIGPQEALQIDVIGAELLSGKYLTDNFGRVQFPLIGFVDLDGVSPTEGASKIADRLRGVYIRDPQVRIVPDEIATPTISIGGEVVKPGSYRANSAQSLIRAVNAAGGVSEFARLDDVLVFRTVGGRDYIGLYSLEAIQRGNYADPKLYANDIVMVGDSPERRRLATILALIPAVTAASIILDRATGSR